MRLTVSPLFYDDYNCWAFNFFTRLLLSGEDSCRMVPQHPALLFLNIWRYAPLYVLFTTPTFLAKQLKGLTLVDLVSLKIPLAVADGITAFYLCKIHKD